MGVTIHFEGRLRDEAAYSALLHCVSAFASKCGWAFESIPSEKRTLSRVCGERDCDYSGMTRGVVVHPAGESEPLRFEFDENNYVQEYCKTQFAGPEVHMAIVSLLREVAPLFVELFVNDEGEYWETGRLDLLAEHMENVSQVIARMLAERPRGRSAVRLPTGRIIDLMG